MKNLFKVGLKVSNLTLGKGVEGEGSLERLRIKGGRRGVAKDCFKQIKKLFHLNRRCPNLAEILDKIILLFFEKKFFVKNLKLLISNMQPR